MKKYLLIATALAALASCTSDDFVGENSSPNPGNGTESAIVFGTGVNTVTRAAHTGKDAADLLNNNFVFAGIKRDGSTTLSAWDATTHPYVFDHYVADWHENTANTTESNSNDWEYVGNTPASTSYLSNATQTIKYWDYSTTQYDFAAYSTGKGAGNTPTYATASKINFANLGAAVTTGTPVYTLAGSADELKACYISDLVTAYNKSNVSDYGKVVTFSFRSLAAKIRLAFFETVPGYSVKNIQFYNKVEYNASTGAFGSDGTFSATPTLLTADDAATLPTGEGTMNIYFPTVGFDSRPGGSSAATDYNKAHITFTNKAAGDLSSTMTFEGLADWASAESNETSTDDPATGWIGRASNTATYAGGSGKYYTILPNEDPNNLMVRIKYTLVSTDGSNEEINVNNATAVIPKELAKWSPNYAYTYIFKISDMTNGTTGVDGSGNTVMGLTPITLNAVVVDSEDGVQETITTVSNPSITTYAKGKVVTENDEYVASTPIYIIVNNGESNVTLSSTNAKLYTATVAEGALQKITEETVDNALRYGEIGEASGKATYTVTDAANKALTLTEATPAEGFLVSSIAATDSPTGNEIVLDQSATKAAKFTPAANTVYVFQYIAEARVDGNYTAVAPVKLSSGTTYYTFNGTTYEAVANVTGDEIVKNNPVYYTASGTGDDVVYTPVAPAKLTAGVIYYTSSRGAGKFVATGSEIVYGENVYWTLNTGEGAPVPSAGSYQYKIIKVQ